MILGSPQFMAPEQAQGTASGPATDLWALGATLYFAVEGRYPFDRGEAIATLAAVVHDEPSPSCQADRLGPVISALLDKAPDRRPSGMQLRSMLESVRSEAGPPVDNRSTTEPALPPGRGTPPNSTRSAISPRGDFRPWLVPVGVAMILVVGGVVWFQNSGDSLPATRSNDPVESSPNEASGAGGAAPSEDPDTSPAVTVPTGWKSYVDPGSGYQLSYPNDWQLIQDASNSIDFRDPETGTYLRIQWTTEPGPSPKGAWKAQAKSFAASHEGYEEIGITRTTYKGHKAAVWEFKYTEGGAQLHAADLGFVMDKEYGFALYFQTREENWDGSQQLSEQLKAAFQPPAV
jgi:serine/threonine protein kinase